MTNDHKPLSVRPAAIEDAKCIHKFISDLQEEEFDEEIFKVLYTECLNNRNNIYLVAVCENLVVGYISCHGQILLHHLGKVFEIQELYVDAEYRNSGVGRLLIKSLEDLIAQENFKSLEVTPNRKRIDAHRFYIDNGFVNSHFKFTKTK